MRLKQGVRLKAQKKGGDSNFSVAPLSRPPESHIFDEKMCKKCAELTKKISVPIKVLNFDEKIKKESPVLFRELMEMYASKYATESTVENFIRYKTALQSSALT